MKKQTTILLSFLLILILAACGGTAETEPTTQTSNTETSQETEPMEESMDDESHSDDMMDDEMSDDMMSDDMMDEEMSDDMEESMDDDMMDDESHSDDMMDEEMSDDMEESMDDDMSDDMMDEEMMDEAMDLPAWQQLPLVNAQTGETFTLADFAGKTVFVEPMATWCSNCRRQLGNVQEAKNSLGDDNVVFIGLSIETNISAQELANYASDNGFDFTWAVMSPELLQALAEEFGQTVANPPATPHFIISPDGSFSSLVTGIEPASDLINQIDIAKG